MEMETLTEVVQSTKQIKIQGFSVTSAMSNGEFFKSRTRWTVGGYDWEVQVVPRASNGSRDYVALNLRFHSEAPTDNNVKANFSCRFIDPSGKLKPSQGSSGTYKFTRGSYTFNIMAIADLKTSGYIKDDAFTVECTIMVLRELAKNAVTHRPADDLAPSSGLHHHLGELLQKGTGADVTLVVSGESFTVHKAILASRSPVFMAEFFGQMKEKRSPRVDIKGMEAAIFRAMLQFIYTDSAPELDRPEDGTAIAQHLLVAADMYGIDRLKLICEDKLYDGINVDTAATTLALAEQHGCSHLKAKCIELIAANLEAAMATEGYKHLMASCPSVMNDLLKAVHGEKN
ncbi:unnamed protein product [Urochloa decumbens]|uniref:Uncharacterized protein n=1 Tax=Urochloa decumbens TaxID=240449 RepID=A0ABC9DI76_9POAL